MIQLQNDLQIKASPLCHSQNQFISQCFTC